MRAQSLAHLGDRSGAVAAIQSALRLAPDNAQASYEAALVYTLVGDRTSAGFNADKARKLGFDERWFGLAWFAAVPEAKH